LTTFSPLLAAPTDDPNGSITRLQQQITDLQSQNQQLSQEQLRLIASHSELLSKQTDWYRTQADMQNQLTTLQAQLNAKQSLLQQQETKIHELNQAWTLDAFLQRVTLRILNPTELLSQWDLLNVLVWTGLILVLMLVLITIGWMITILRRRQVDPYFLAEDSTTAASGGLSEDQPLNYSYLAGEDETASKLDLSKAYIDMGDFENAKIVLENVLEKGNVEQRSDAQKLLQEIKQKAEQKK
jgi:FimV-like protein